MLRRRRWWAATIIVPLVLTATACGSSKGSASGGSTKGPISLRMTVWSSNKAQLALFNQIGDDYKKSHPNVTSITFDPLPFDSYTTSLTTQIAGGNPPDMGWIFERDAPSFVSSGALYDLTPMLKAASGYQYGDLLPAPLKLWQNKGDLYAYPFSTSPFGLFYNADLFAKAGIPTPDQMISSGTWTWENAEQAAAKIDAATGQYGLVVRDFDYKLWEQLAQIWRGFGAAPWSADGKTCQFDQPAMVQAMTFIHKAIFTDKAMPPPGTSVDFFAGNAGMTTTQISRASLLKDAKFKWGLVPLPKGPAGDAQVVGQAGIGVFVKGKHAKVAADFLAFFTNPANSAKLAQYFPPPRASLLNASTLSKANPLLSKQQLQSVVIDGIKSGNVLPSHLDFSKIEDVVRAALDPMWQPNANVSAVLKQVCTAEAPLLKGTS
jgi:multiple sugar transport system substrate-binding protein